MRDRMAVPIYSVYRRKIQIISHPCKGMARYVRYRHQACILVGLHQTAVK